MTVSAEEAHFLAAMSCPGLANKASRSNPYKLHMSYPWGSRISNLTLAFELIKMFMIDETMDGSASSSVIVAFNAFAAWSLSSHVEKSRTENVGPSVAEGTAPSGANAIFIPSVFPRLRASKTEFSISISSKTADVESTVINSSREVSKEKSVPGGSKGCCICFDASEGSR